MENESIVEKAKKVPKLRRSGVILSDSDCVDLLLAYCNREVTGRQIKEIVNVQGYHIKGTNALQVLLARLPKLIKENKVKLIKL